jgi:hypothetical protein
VNPLGLDEPTATALPPAPAPASPTLVVSEPTRPTNPAVARANPTAEYLDIQARSIADEVVIGSLAIQDPAMFTVASARSGLPNRHEAADPRTLPNDGEDGTGRMSLANATTATGLALTAGTVWWALRAGGLLTSLVVSMPAWRHADLLAVLPDDEDDEDSWDPSDDEQAARDEEAVGQVLDPRFDGVAS